MLVYIREAHPDSLLYVPGENGEKKLAVIPQTASSIERLKNLQQCASLLGLTFPAVIDSDDNVVNRAYAAWPDRLYVVDTDGKIAYKGGPGPAGFRVTDLEAWLKARNAGAAPR